MSTSNNLLCVTRHGDRLACVYLCVCICRWTREVYYINWWCWYQCINNNKKDEIYWISICDKLACYMCYIHTHTHISLIFVEQQPDGELCLFFPLKRIIFFIFGNFKFWNSKLEMMDKMKVKFVIQIKLLFDFGFGQG